MNARPFASLCRRTFVAASFALALPLSALAVDNAPPEAQYVKVYPDHYVAAGKPFANLAALEAWASTIVIRTVCLDFCGPVSTKQPLTTVERFHSAYPLGIQVRTSSQAEERCASEAESKSWPQGALGPLRANVEYLAIDENGRSMLP